MDDVDYTVKLTDSNLSTLATRVREGLNLDDPMSLFYFENLLNLQELLNQLGVKPELKNIASTDFQERWSFLQAVNATYLSAIEGLNPNWKDNLPEDQRENVEAFQNLLANPSPVLATSSFSDDETLIAA